VFKLLDRPDGDWPIMLCALCASILGFLALWFAAKVINSVFEHDRAQSPRRLQNNALREGFCDALVSTPLSGKTYRRPRR
jgi:hypothetical protein